MIVVDASALVDMLLQTPRAASIQGAVGDEAMVAPDLINVEVLSALRRLTRRSVLSPVRANEAVADLLAAPIRRFPSLPLLDETWRLRDNLSAYDACYVALAAALDCALISGDARLARASQLPATVIAPRG